MPQKKKAFQVFPLSEKDGEKFIKQAKTQRDFVLNREIKNRYERLFKKNRIPLAICLVAAQLKTLPLELIYTRMMRQVDTTHSDVYPHHKIERALYIVLVA